MNIRKMPTIPTLPKKKQVAAYARVSSGKDAMLHSLSAQISYYSAFIQKQPEWLYCGVYVDEAVTGTKTERPEFQRLLSDCRAGKIDMIITKSISRFARNTVTLLATVRELKAIGVDVFFEEPHIHTMSAAGEMMLTLLASVAQEESRMTSERMKWRVRHAFENGELMNFRFMFGYRVRKGIVVVDEKEAAVVRTVFNRALNGDSLSKIANDLNRSGVRHVFGGKWTAARIRELLSNEKYTGNALLQKSYRNNHIEKKEVINRGELTRYYAEGTHTPIVSESTFQEAQKLLSRISDKTAGRAKQLPSPFTSMIVCEKCGKKYKHIHHNGCVAWNCTTYLTQGKAVCHEKRIPESILYSITTDILEINAVDRETLVSRIIEIRARDNKLTFCLTDGTIVQREWSNPSRACSWTPEMKETARTRTIQQRAMKKEGVHYGSCNQNTGDEEQVHIGADVANA